MINLHLQDCMDLMKNTPDDYYELAIVNPPYGIGADNKNNGENSVSHEKLSVAKINVYKKTNWDSVIPTDKYFNELKRVSRKQIIWGANYFRLKGGMLYWHKNVTMPTYSTYKWILKNYAKEGDKIFDTHLGSMSIAIACYDMGFDLTGCEIDKDCFTAGVDRLKQHAKQQDMFRQPQEINIL